jgi:hypothetical protein
MKIMICGSMSFAEKMRMLQHDLQEMGHEVLVPADVDLFIENPKFNDDLALDREHLMTNDVIRKCFDLLAASEFVLFLNYPKNGISGYLGASMLMEIGLAYYLRKEICLLFPLPSAAEARWAHEVSSFSPLILNGDIEPLRNK